MAYGNHVICAPCYHRKEPGRQPVQLTDELRDEYQCCFCGELTSAGIYYRADSAETVCGRSGGCG